jgi:hypothetical protein
MSNDEYAIVLRKQRSLFRTVNIHTSVRTILG